jgi:hypothetical protein
MTIDIIDIILFSIFLFYIGWKVREIQARITLDRIINRIEVEDLDEEMVPINIEKHDNAFFVYDVSDNSFMAQGNTRGELEMNLAKRFPEKKFLASPTNLREIGFDK